MNRTALGYFLIAMACVTVVAIGLARLGLVMGGNGIRPVDVVSFIVAVLAIPLGIAAAVQYAKSKSSSQR